MSDSTYASTSSLPDIASLTRGLEIAFGISDETSSGGIHVLDRRANIHASSLPSEFVRCRIPDGRVLDLFCKYTGEDFEDCHGHRGSAGYEAAVYQQLVNPLAVAAPHCYGSSPGVNSDGTWVYLEALDGVERVTEWDNQESAMQKAASEIGRFQRLSDACLERGTTGLTRYTGDYYLGWIRRTAEYAESMDPQRPWLNLLGEHGEELMMPLLDAPQVVIHGEFYPHNLLCRDDAVFLIDWQSTAIGAGEIDLAALTEKWPDDIVAACTQAYVEARWPEGAPPAFEQTLATARLYLVFRWLGDRPEWTNSPRSEWGFEQLRLLAERMGLA